MTESPVMPTRVRIGNVAYTVKCDPETTRQVRLDENKPELQGMYRSTSSLIMVADDMNLDVTQDTLVHEAIHAVIWHVGLSGLLREESLEETLVSSLTNELIRLLRENPAFVEYVIGPAGSE